MPLLPMGTPAVVEAGGIRFGMLNDRAAVPCYVDLDAIEDIEDASPETPAEKLAIFYRHRERFEAIASALFDDGLTPRVRGKHLLG